MELKKLVGFHKFYSQKKNQWYLVADCVCDVTQRDKANGFVGNEKVEQIFIPEELWQFFESQPDKVIGKVLEFQYAVSGRYFNLVNVIIKS